MNNLPKIYYVRHGETDWNAQGLIQGSADIDLNAKGMGQLEAVALALAAKRDELAGFEFYCSPQLRARHSMQIICTALGRDMTTVKIDRRLRELEFGIYEGRIISEVHAISGYPTDPVGHFNWCPPGGESYADGMKRVAGFLAEITQPSLIVAHGAVARCVIANVCNIPGPEATHLPTPQGCYCVLENGTYQWVNAVANA